MAEQTSLDIVKIVPVGKMFSWTRQARNGKITHEADKPYKTKHSAIIAAVRENSDIFRENLRDATGAKVVPCTSVAVNRLRSKNLAPVSEL